MWPSGQMGDAGWEHWLQLLEGRVGAEGWVPGIEHHTVPQHSGKGVRVGTGVPSLTLQARGLCA